ncbi:MAG: 3-hydroxyacyl-CoA dehydrogenase NAD-binding domain-containing protein [Pseudomonadota bacterium]
MADRIDKVAILGAGVMGQGIAAHLANAGVRSILLDIVPPKFGDDDKAAGLNEKDRAFRNKFAIKGKEAALKAKPALFYTNVDADLVEVGNLEDDLGVIGECQWVVEAVIERLDIKQQLFEKVEKHWKPGCIITSNTSGLKIKDMLKGRGEGFCSHFLVTHFFNPVRYMPLLEIVVGDKTDKAVLERMVEFGRNALGKGIVFGKDTPNFVGNRIGVYAMFETVKQVLEGGYTVEEVDAIFGPATLKPKSGIFRLADMVGIDTLVHVANNSYDNLPEDEKRDTFKVPDFIKTMVERGMIGQKAKQGFFKKVGKDIQTLDLKTLEYRDKQKAKFDCIGASKSIEDPAKKLRTVMFGEDRGAKLAWNVTKEVLIYSANRVGEIADDVVNIDAAMRWGFNWEAGPFEMWDMLGVEETVARMKKEGLKVPAWVEDMLKAGHPSFYKHDKGDVFYYDVKTKKTVPLDEGEKVMRLQNLKEGGRVLDKNGSANLVDLGDGVYCVEFDCKMNAVDADLVAMIHKGLDRAEAEGCALVLANDDKQAFSAGANLMLVFMAAQNKQWDELRKVIVDFQAVNKRMRYSPVPVVAAPHQLALGGGCEMTMWTDHVRAHAELYMGLVEVGVGLLPAGGGTTEMVARSLMGIPDDPGFAPEMALKRGLEAVAMAKVSMSAEMAKELMLLRPGDGYTVNRDHVLYSAKQAALGLARAGYRPPRPRSFRLPGPSGYATFKAVLSAMRDGHFMSDHDLKVGLKIAEIFTGGDTSMRVKVTEDRLLEMEQEAFLSLCGEQLTLDRIQYMLMNNKPLRN